MASIQPAIPVPLPVDGLRGDLDDFALPPTALRSNGRNLLLRDGQIVTRPGTTKIAQVTDVKPIGMIDYEHSFTGHVLVHATQSAWWFYQNSSQTWIDVSDPSTPWANTGAVGADFRVFNSGGNTYLIGVNGLDSPRAWDSLVANKWVTLGISAPAARALAIVADRLILAERGAVAGPVIEVSAFQDPFSGWGTTQTAVLVDTPGDIISMKELGANQTAIYKDDAIHLTSGLTGNVPLRFDLWASSVPGPMSLRSVVPLNSRVHAILTADAEVYLFDGVSYNPHPSSERVQALVNANITPQSSSKLLTHGSYNPIANEIWWFYSRAGLEGVGARDAVVLNLINGSVWKVDYNDAGLSFWASLFGTWFAGSGFVERLFLGDNTGQFYIQEGNTDDGTAIGFEGETGLSPLGDATQDKTVLESEHYFANPSTNQTVNIGIRTSTAGQMSSSVESQALTLTPTNTKPYVTGHRKSNGERITSRFLGLNISGTALTEPVHYRGSTITVAPRGER